MQTILAHQAASISELKRNPSRLIENAQGHPVAILNHNIAAAYLIPAKTYERLLQLLDDHQLQTLVTQRLSDKTQSIKVNIDDL